MKYRSWLKTQGPSWLRARNGQALSGEIGGEVDVQQDRLTQGLLARFPLKGSVGVDGRYGLAPADALDQQGEDREMRRGPAETDASYGARLWDAWSFKVHQGSHWGILRSLQIAGYADMVIVQDNGRWAKLVGSTGVIGTDLSMGSLMTCADRAGTPPGWMFDAREGEFYAQFGLVFTLDHANLQSASGQAILTDIVNAWKASNKVYRGAAVQLPPVSGTRRTLGWPTGRTLVTEPNLGGFSVRIIPGDGTAPYVIGP